MATSRTGTTKWLHLAATVKRRARAAGLTRCPRCGVELDWAVGLTPRSAEVDHIVPWAQGGTDELENLQILCRSCNLRKGDGKVRSRKRRRRLPSPVRVRDTAESGDW
ncbi:HNH endonuclease [Actinomyces procaprae]|uniref:HNH endonuclease n=1 Tax=Actinomyces procaprae TaxID=2560010 RepID=UPI0010A23344|nr:HNH endonuclease signature motif containing protein [Actinomyces procaprae]